MPKDSLRAPRTADATMADADDDNASGIDNADEWPIGIPNR